MDSIESRCVIGPENILFAGVSVQLSARNFTGWGSEGVNMDAVHVQFCTERRSYLKKYIYIRSSLFRNISR